MLIGGRWFDAASGRTFATYNPATGEVLAQVAEGDRADVNQAVKAAGTAFEGGPWRKLTASERGKLIWKLADLLETHTEEFAQLESLGNGKPVSVARHRSHDSDGSTRVGRTTAARAQLSGLWIFSGRQSRGGWPQTRGEGLLCGADRACRYQARHESHAGRNLRASGLCGTFHRRGGSPSGREQLHLWTGGGGLDP